MPKVDIVIPIFNERENLDALHDRIYEACEACPGIEWRVIYVNDGSEDDSLEAMLKQNQADQRFTIVDLSRNFGHQAAIAAGLALSEGDAVIVMDGDLQDPPECIPDLIEEWRKGAQVVRAQRRSRSERGIRRIGFDFFHAVFEWISDFPIQTQTGVFGLLDRPAVEEINRLVEQNRFFPGLRSWVGFRQSVTYYDRPERLHGAPKQSLRKLIAYGLDAILSFSYKPLRIMTLFGICVSAIGFILACTFIIRRLTGIETAQTGFTTLVTLILFLGGGQIIAIGLLGEYLARIYDEVKRRPLYIIQETRGIRKKNG